VLILVLQILDLILALQILHLILDQADTTVDVSTFRLQIIELILVLQILHLILLLELGNFPSYQHAFMAYLNSASASNA
jgi:hypothetical protein